MSLCVMVTIYYSNTICLIKVRSVAAVEFLVSNVFQFRTNISDLYSTMMVVTGSYNVMKLHGTGYVVPTYLPRIII